MNWLKTRITLPGNTNNVLNQDIPTARETLLAVRSLSPKQQLSFGALVFAGCIALMLLILYVNNIFLVEVPARGGELTEGVIGFPRLINPLFLAKNDAERDIAALTYSGLMRLGKEGTLEPDLAERYEATEDGRTYTFTLKENLTWHDGAPITASDIVFTIKKAQDPLLKSPRRAQWEGVTVEAIDNKTVVFTLAQPFAGFLENTTLGILPEHIWKSIPIEEFSLTNLNEEPIGSGPYEFTKAKRDRSGIPTSYEFNAFDDFALGEPYIQTITVRFYPNEELLQKAFTDRDIDSVAALSAASARTLVEKGARIISPTDPLPRVFAVFFNQDQQPLFTDEAVRHALSQAVPRESFIDQVLDGFASPLTSPLPPGVLGAENAVENASASSSTTAATILEQAGWTLPEGERVRTNSKDVRLAFTLVTANTPEFKAVTQALKAIWESIGAEVTVNFFEQNDLTENVIRPREYDALFFGEAVGRDPDPYSFWHSSQRNDPGLNVALYANITADDVLERARVEINQEKRASLLHTFQDEVIADTPAVFLYAPHFVYVIPEDLGGAELKAVAQPSERFAQVHTWFVRTDHIWKLFTD